MNTKNVLIVDQDPDWLSAFGELLTLVTGTKPFTARNIDEAQFILSQGPIDIIFAETTLDDLSGISLLQRVKAEFKHIRVIIFFDGLRGSNMSADDVLAFGADRVLTKLQAVPLLSKHLPNSKYLYN
jgi:DNA-binding response OmpR family regulator